MTDSDTGLAVRDCQACVFFDPVADGDRFGQRSATTAIATVAIATVAIAAVAI